ncbi:PP2C family protein-serine/threonine phosphatase [Chloroflexota bacterium]
MRLQHKFLISIISLLVITASAISIFTVNGTTKSMLAQTEYDGKSISRVLAQSSSFAERVPGQFENALGEQMVVEARITANMVAIAEGRAGMSAEEIKAILKDITENTVLDEFWITDETGRAYLTNTGIDFTFSPDLIEQPQAYVFYQLLGQTNGEVRQEAKKREIDTRFFKYVGVSGIDKPRIVQVGYEANLLDDISKDVNSQRLVDELTGQANVAAIRILNSRQQVIASSSNPVRGIGENYSEGDVRLVAKAISSQETVSATEGNVLHIATPILDNSGNVQMTIMVYLTTENVQAAIRESILRTVLVSLVVIVVGIIISFVLSNGITRPVRKLTDAVQIMGQGDLSHRVEVKSRDEVGVLARSFNKMADDLKSYLEDLRRTTAEKERMQKEMEIGKGIQQSFLPDSPPDVDGFDIAALNTPALEVGGDFFDFIPISLEKWGLVIADVSGKGVPAALFMALSRTLIRAYTKGNPTISETILRANNMIAEGDRANMFVTLFYGVLDSKRKTLTYVNAGHNPPMVLGGTEGGIVILSAKGLALGVMQDITLEEKEIQLHKGETLLLYTDGVTEAVNRENEQFGPPRLAKLVEDNHNLSAQELIKRVEQEVITFSQGQPQFDDLTLMVVKVL